MTKKDEKGANVYGLAAGIAFFVALVFVSLKNAKGPEPDPGFLTLPSQQELDSIEFGKAPNIKSQIIK